MNDLIAISFFTKIDVEHKVHSEHKECTSLNLGVLRATVHKVAKTFLNFRVYETTSLGVLGGSDIYHKTAIVHCIEHKKMKRERERERERMRKKSKN